MNLEQAEWRDVLTILHETDRIWSSGLSAHDYHDYIWLQINHRWGKRNFRYFVLKDRGEVVASCKLYNLQMSSRGKIYSVGGIGAIYTREKFRGRHFASALIQDVIELCIFEKFDGLILFSEIGAQFYHPFGFVELGSANFSLAIPFAQAASGEISFKAEDSAHPSISVEGPRPGADVSPPAQTLTLAQGRVSQLVTTSSLCHADVDWTALHYRRWLRYQPFGVHRSNDYWHYKISREHFLHAKSELSWPALELSKLELDKKIQGYAITECGGSTIRVLEVVGDEQGRMLLWQSLVERALVSGFQRIRGWESVIRDFGPNYKLNELLTTTSGCEQKFADLHYTERDWGLCMMLPLNSQIDDWLDVNPCPMLELDHL